MHYPHADILCHGEPSPQKHKGELSKIPYVSIVEKSSKEEESYSISNSRTAIKIF